jgi:hypothetical protein
LTATKRLLRPRDPIALAKLVGDIATIRKSVTVFQDVARSVLIPTSGKKQDAIREAGRRLTQHGPPECTFVHARLLRPPPLNRQSASQAVWGATMLGSLARG